MMAAMTGWAGRSPPSCPLISSSSRSAERSQTGRRDAGAPRSASTSSSSRRTGAPTSSSRAPAGAWGASSQQKLHTATFPCQRNIEDSLRSKSE